MSELSGDLDKWARVRIPDIVSDGELREIRLDVVLVDSQFVEWLAGGRSLEGREFQWLQARTAQLLNRIDDCSEGVAGVDEVAALRGYVERMKRLLDGDGSALFT